MFEKKKLRIASCANENFATGLMVSLISCLAHASGKFNYEFFVLDGGLQPCTKKRLELLLQECSKIVDVRYTLKYIEPSQEKVQSLPERPGSGSWMTYARFLLAEMIPGDHLIYLDSDVLCFRGVEEFFTSWDGEAAIVAARDPKELLSKDWPLSEKKPDGEMYFNAGIILMNLKWMRENLSLVQVNHWIKRIGLGRLNFADQTILNLAARHSVIEVDRKNNWVLATKYAAQVPALWKCCNLHYIGRVKPWHRSETDPVRLFSEILYHRASVVYGVGGVSERELDEKKLGSVRRKSLCYQFIKPKRAKVYQAVLKSIKSTEELIDENIDIEFFKSK